jgi:hypothetical protein
MLSRSNWYGFGKERHDDLVDALTMMVSAVYEKKDRTVSMFERFNGLFGILMVFSLTFA